MAHVSPEYLLAPVTLWSGRPGCTAEADQAVAWRDGNITWCGPAAEAPQGSERIDGGGRLLTPGLIDCHTHLVYAGQRAAEWRQKLEGQSYAEIAQAGGGIRSTVTAVRGASDAELFAQSDRRLAALLREGVTTVEIKSGYGLDTATEIRMLETARALGRRRPVDVTTTFLGAHAVPAGRDPDDYIDEVCKVQLPAVAARGLADAVDGFCESIGFSTAQIERVFTAAQAHGLPVKLHAEQLSDSGGTELAARFDALSCDHLEYVSERGIAALARAGSVAVLLPGAFYFLGETRLPPVAKLRAAGVPLAVATDSNPGSSPLTSPLLAMNMACTLFGLTVDEALHGMTSHAARALGVGDRTGQVEAGLSADLALWEAAAPDELIYSLGHAPLHLRIWRGQPD